MALVLQNIRKVLKPNGYVMFRDYATGDLAQERFTCKDQKICENFYARGDGTRAYYFSNEFLRRLFEENGFVGEEIGLCCKQVENRSRELVMNRRWIQAVFRHVDFVESTPKKGLLTTVDQLCCENFEPKVKEDASNELSGEQEMDISEGFAFEMFTTLPSNEVIEVPMGGFNFKIAILSKEHQHTCKSTGLMLWESAHLMSSILSGNPSIVAGKRVLELGAGCGGICSMIAVQSADLVVATDGDTKTLDLLAKNVASNLEQRLLEKLITRRLEWGNKAHMESIKVLNERGFDLIIGTDVAYVSEAIGPLFATARDLISPGEGSGAGRKPAFVLCHILRRVDEPSILAAASQHGFCLVDQWGAGTPTSSSRGVIGSWFSGHNPEGRVPNTSLRIMYFQID